VASTDTHHSNIKQIAMAVLILLSFFTYIHPTWASSNSASKILLPIVGDALVKARAQDWQQVSSDLQEFEKGWKDISEQDKGTQPSNGQKVEQALSQAKSALQEATVNPELVLSTLTALANATDQLSDGTATTNQSSKKDLEQLSTSLKKSLDALGQNNWEEAKNQYRKFENGWSRVEGGLRKDSFATYANLETKMSLAHVALGMEKPDHNKAVSALQNLMQEIQDYLNGKVETTSKAVQGQTIGDLMQLLNTASKDIALGNIGTAAATMQHFIEVWPSVEGQVQTRSPKAYTDVEIQMTQALELLSSNPVKKDSAQQVIQSMKDELEPFVNVSHYTAFEAGMVLFREGLEALLVVSALLAFLQRTGNGKKQVWIWTGVGSGLGVSAGLAAVMSLFFSSVTAGGNRETIEGVTGLVAVVMMFTVGVWLHSKSSGKAWNQYIHHQMDTALAKGSLWSLTIVAFLAIVREGAETIIFYLGMAASIEQSQLLLGIGGAIVLLVILGVVIIQFSVRIPIKPFFMVASVFIYYIAFKFLGESVHVLQIEGWFFSHTWSKLPTIDWLGIYPTWESSLAQAVLLLLIVAIALWNKRKQSIGKNSSGVAYSK
jgi:high-affinity iron transporter